MEKVILGPATMTVINDNGKKRTVKSEHLYQFLWYPLEVKNIRMRDILRIVNYHPDIWSNVLGEWALPEWSKCYMLKAGPVKKRLKKVIAYVGAEISTWDNYRCKMKQTKKGLVFQRIKPKVVKKRKEFSIGYDCSGAMGGRRFYALDLAPIDTWIDAEVVVDNNCVVWVCDYTHSGRRKKSFGEKIICVYSPTVLEVFKAIFYEITFCGTPEDTHDKMIDLKQKINDIKSGKVGTKPSIFK